MQPPVFSSWRLVCFGGLVLSLLAVCPAEAQRSPSMSAAPDSSFSLQAYQWENRLLLMFAPSAEAPAFREQLQRLEAAEDGLAERDLLLIRVFGDGASRVGNRPISPEAAHQLRGRFDVAPAHYRLILVGLDGTEKRREASPISVKSLFETIDAMPMRQREMRRDADGGGGHR